MTSRILMILVVPFLLAVGCQRKATAAITVDDPWVRAASRGANSAAFMVVNNGTGQADRLVSAECAAAMMVEIHQTTIKDDVASMTPVDSIEAPARGRVALAPAGYHVMLMGLKQDLSGGDKVDLTLVFQNAGRVVVAAEVRKP